MSLRPAVPGGDPQDRRHPFSRSYGANLPSSLARVTPRRLGLLTQGHLCRFSVRARGLLPGSLFTGPGDRVNPPQTAGPSRLHPVLAMTALPGLQRLDGEAGFTPAPHSPYPKPSGAGLALPQAYPRGTGILTRFPFGGCELRPSLGPANPRPRTRCRGTLALPAEGILTPPCCYYRRDFQHWRVHRTSRPGF